MAVLATAGGRALLLGGHLIGAVAGPLSSLSLIDFVTAYGPAQPVVQRRAGTTAGTVPVLFGFMGSAPSAVQARVVRAVGGSVVVDWTGLTGLVTGLVTGRGVLQGVPQGQGYLLQVRDGVTQPVSGSLFSSGSVSWGVGVVFLAGGQSNQVNTFSGNTYSQLVPGSSLGEDDWWEANTPGPFFDENGFHGPGANDGTRGPSGTSSIDTKNGNCAMFVRLVAAALKAKYGIPVPVCLVPWAFNSNPIENFLRPLGPHYVSLFGNNGVARGTAGAQGTIGFGSPGNATPNDFEGLIWHQGEANQGDSASAYIGKLQALCQQCLDYVSASGRTPAQFLFAPAVLGNYDPTACPSIENIRSAAMTFVAQARAGTLPGQATPWTGVQVGWTTIDLWRGTGPVGSNPPTDTLHFQSTAAQLRSLRRVIQTVLGWLGCAAFGGAGPRLAGTVARVGQVATFDVVLGVGTALVASGAITGWYANTAADFTGSDIGVTVALAAGGTKVAVTLPVGTVFPVFVKHLGGRVGSTATDPNGFVASCYPDIRHLVYDNSTYPTGAASSEIEVLGLPLLPSNGAIAVN